MLKVWISNLNQAGIDQFKHGDELIHTIDMECQEITLFDAPVKMMRPL